MVSASSKRLTRRSKGRPNIEKSRSFQPVPSPSTKRPPLISSIASACLAVTPGLRKSEQLTKAPSVTRLVTAASAVIMLHISHQAL